MSVAAMNFYRVMWRDQERNRAVEVFVDYRASATGVEIIKLRPTRVLLLSESGEAVRRIIHVRTQAGQRFLARQFEQAQEKLGGLTEQIRLRHRYQDRFDDFPLAV